MPGPLGRRGSPRAPGRPRPRPMGTPPATTWPLPRAYGARISPRARAATTRSYALRWILAALAAQRRWVTTATISAELVRVLEVDREVSPDTGPPGEVAWPCHEPPRPKSARRAAAPAAAGTACRRPCSARPGGGPARPTRPRARISSDSSSIRARRLSSSSSPVIEYSLANSSLPRPTPSVSRPPLSRSSVAVSRATFTGRRRASGVTSRPEPDALGRGGDRRQRDLGVGLPQPPAPASAPGPRRRTRPSPPPRPPPRGERRAPGRKARRRAARRGPSASERSAISSGPVRSRRALAPVGVLEDRADDGSQSAR